MLKKILLLMCAMALMLTLAGCKVNKSEKPADNAQNGTDNIPETPEEPEGEYIFTSGSTLKIVSSSAEAAGENSTLYGELVQNVFSAVAYSADVDIRIVNDSTPAAKHEIIIGNADRELSKKAYKLLSRMDIEDGKDAYVICSDGYSIAVAYTTECGFESAEIALERFIAEHLEGKSRLVLSSNYSDGVTFDPIEYFAERDEKQLNEEWSTLEKRVALDMAAVLGEEEAEAYAKDFISALRQLYTLYDDKIVGWLANLYDPEICFCTNVEHEEKCLGTRYCGGAGFYFSNSGRNTKGYMPDIETTSQALGFLSATGMLKLVKGNISSAFPEGEAEKIVRFVKALQDEQTGYFYHPQWEVETLQTSRIARDLNYGISILNKFGAKPTYDAPDGSKGDGILYDGTTIESVAPASTALTARLAGKSAATMVSKVVATASYAPDYLLSEENFAAYLEGLNVREDSYYAGNELASTATQIVNRDNYLKSIGADYSLVDMAIEYLNKNQNPNTGTWDYKTEGDKDYTPYYGNDGVLKIVSFYNSVKRPMNHALKAVENAINAITVDYTPGHVCNVYNSWLSVSQILNNIRAYGDRAEADAVMVELRKIAPEAIRITQEKLALFQKDDKSFSYFINQSSSGSQGAPVAVPDSNEGDVNATVICTYGTVDFMFQALGWRDYMVSLYTDSDRRYFKSIIEDLSPVIKNNEVDPSDPITFDDGGLGNAPEGIISYRAGNNLSELYTVRRAGDNLAARLESPSGSYDVIEVTTVSGLGGRTFVFSGDFKIESASDGYFLQINMSKNPYDSTVYMLAFKKANGKIEIWDCSTTLGSTNAVTTKLAEASLNQWFNVRAEYYTGDHDTVRIKVYFNEELVCVTDNYFDEYGTKLSTGVGTPNTGFDRTRLGVMTSSNVVMEVDNLSGYKCRDRYEPSEREDLVLNVDRPAEEENIYFSESTDALPDSFTVNSGNVEAVTENSDSFLRATGAGEVIIPVTYRDASGKCVSVEFELDPESVGTGKYMVLSLLNRVDGDLYLSSKDPVKIFGLLFEVVETGGEKYLVIYEYPNGTRGEEIFRDYADKPFSFRLDYFGDKSTALMYLNGSLPEVSVAINDYAARFNAGRVSFSFVGAESNTLALDNIRVELGKRDFEKDIAPGVESESHKFEGGLGKVEVSSSSSAVIVPDSDGSALSVSGNAYLTVPTLERSPVYNASVFEAKLVINGGESRILFLDGEGEPIFVIDAVTSGGKVNFFEVGAGSASEPFKRYPYSLCEAECGKEITLRAELFRADKMAIIYLNGKACDVTAMLYTPNDTAGGFASLKVMGLSSDSSFIIDDIKAETLYSYYVLPDSVNKTNTESATAGLTYDSSSLLNLPTALTGEFYSAKASYKIVQMLKCIDQVESYEKVLKFEKEGTTYDWAWINSTTDRNASMYVFETDMMIDTEQRKENIAQLLLGDKSNRSSFAYYFLIYIDADGYVCFQESSSLNGDGNHKRWTSRMRMAEVGEWFNIRVEYYSGNKNNVRIKVYLNGELLGVSDNYYGWHAVDNPSATPSNFFDRVQLYSWKGKQDFYFDNTKIYSSSGSCTDAVTFDYTTP